jgi:hypothetical protein
VEPVTLFGALGGGLSILSWMVNLAGAALALVMYIRRRSTAALLAILGFGIPVLLGPVVFAARYLVADNMGIEGLLAVNTCSGVFGLFALILLVVAFWLALNRE